MQRKRTIDRFVEKDTKIFVFYYVTAVVTNYACIVKI